MCSQRNGAINMTAPATVSLRGERGELYILKHDTSPYDRAIRSVARRWSPAIELRDGLLQRTLHTVRADDKSA